MYGGGSAIINVFNIQHIIIITYNIYNVCNEWWPGEFISASNLINKYLGINPIYLRGLVSSVVVSGKTNLEPASVVISCHYPVIPL